MEYPPFPIGNTSTNNEISIAILFYQSVNEVQAKNSLLSSFQKKCIISNGWKEVSHGKKKLGDFPLPIGSMGLVYLPTFWLAFMVDVVFTWSIWVILVV